MEDQKSVVEAQTEIALKALDSLKKKDIQELKALGSPPRAVVELFELVLVMFDVKYKKDNVWKSA